MIYNISALISFSSALLTAYVFNKTGFFKKSVYTLLLAAEGNCKKFYLGILAFTTLSVWVFNNVYAALIFIPVLYGILKDSGFNEDIIRIFLFSCIIIAEISSICFMSSNLNNLIYAERFSILFGEFASNLLFIGLLGIIITTFVLYASFKNELKCRIKNENLKNPDDMIIDWTLFNIEILVIMIVVIGSFIFSSFRFSHLLLSLSGSLILYFLYLYKENEDKKFKIKDTCILFLIFAFMVFGLIAGKFLIRPVSFIQGTVYSGFLFENAAVFGAIQMLLSWLANSITVSAASSVIISKINILPCTRDIYIYSSMIFCDIGGILMPWGSFSIIIYHAFLKRIKLKTGIFDYIRLSVRAVLPALVVMISLFFLNR